MNTALETNARRRAFDEARQAQQLREYKITRYLSYRQRGFSAARARNIVYARYDFDAGQDD